MGPPVHYIHQCSNPLMYITTNKPPVNSNSNPNRTTKHHAVVNIRLNMVTCPTCPEK